MVFGRLVPQDQRFFDVVLDLGKKVRQGVVLFRELLEHTAELEAYAQRIKDIEHEADALTHRMAEMLNTTFVTPLDHTDLHDLVSRLDDIMDFTDSATQRMWLYGCGEPPQQLKEMAVVLEKQCVEMERALAALPQLKRGPKPLMEACHRIRQLEKEGDALLRTAMADLFKTPGVDAVYILKWKDVIEKFEVAIDCADDAGNVLEGIALKNG